VHFVSGSGPGSEETAQHTPGARGLRSEVAQRIPPRGERGRSRQEGRQGGKRREGARRGREGERGRNGWGGKGGKRACPAIPRNTETRHQKAPGFAGTRQATRGTRGNRLETRETREGSMPRKHARECHRPPKCRPARFTDHTMFKVSHSVCPLIHFAGALSAWPLRAKPQTVAPDEPSGPHPRAGPVAGRFRPIAGHSGACNPLGMFRLTRDPPAPVHRPRRRPPSRRRPHTRNGPPGGLLGVGRACAVELRR
jgi:hypothetical protein